MSERSAPDVRAGGRTEQFARRLHALRLDATIRDHTERHILDTVAAIATGSVLPVGRRAITLLEQGHESGSATVCGHHTASDARTAALLNGVFAHADETDDSHDESRTHPGASVVPAALATAETHRGTRDDLLLAVARGYEACAAISLLAWPDSRSRRRAQASPTSIGGTWGSSIAAAHIASRGQARLESVFAYAAQFSSGNGGWLRDTEHLEKAVVFGGMPALNGVSVGLLAAAGWVGIPDPLDAEPNLFTSLGLTPTDAPLDELLGPRAVIEVTGIKRFCVGSPAQAAVQAAVELASEIVDAQRITAVRIHLPADLAFIVDGRKMHDVNVQWLVAHALSTGACSFGDIHLRSGQRPDHTALVGRISLVASEEMEMKRQALVEVDLTSGETLKRHVFPVHGTKEAPMSRADVERKAMELLSEVLDADAVDRLLSAFERPEADLATEIGRALQKVQDPRNA